MVAVYAIILIIFIIIVMSRKYKRIKRNSLKLKHNQPKYHIKRRIDNPFDVPNTVAQLKGPTTITCEGM